VAYAIDGIELPDQPASNLVDFTLAIEEQGLQTVALGSYGWVRPSHSLALARSQREGTDTRSTTLTLAN
jgi:hypothetical protein